MTNSKQNQHKQYLIELEGYDGPHEDKYLEGYSIGKGEKKFRTLIEAQKAALEDSFCSGITYTRTGFFTLRKGKSLYDSNKHDKFKSKEISWLKINPPRPKRKKNIIVTRKKNLVIEEIKDPKNISKYKEDEIYEIITYRNTEMYYNPISKKLVSMDGKEIGNFTS